MNENEVITTDHEEILKWAEANGASPQILGTPDTGYPEIALRLDFIGTADEVFFNSETQTQNISWEEFFDRFERDRLAFVYQINPQDPNPSNNYHFLKRDQFT